MEKNKNLMFVIALIVIALLFRYSGFMGSLFAPEDDYVILDDFSEGVFELPYSETKLEGFPCGSTTSGICNWWRYSYWNDNYRFDYIPTDASSKEPYVLPLVKNEKLQIVGEACGATCEPRYNYNPTMTLNKDIKGIDFKFDIDPSISCSAGPGAHLDIYLNDILVYVEGTRAGGTMFTMEFKSHLLDKNLIDVYAKGVYINTFNITDGEVYVKIKTMAENVGSYPGANLGCSFKLDNLKFRIKFS